MTPLLSRRACSTSCGGQVRRLNDYDMPMRYFDLLTARLAGGVARRPADYRARHAAYLTAAQNADGGFSGRAGGSDLYYTAFALRGLAILDVLTPEICAR